MILENFFYEIDISWKTIGIILFIMLIFIIYYNIMLKKQNKIRKALSTIDIMLKKRNDLIPNLVNSVKGIMDHEQMVLDKVTELRNNLSMVSKEEIYKVNSAISDYLLNIMFLSENYPSLKSNKNFLDLQKNLHDIEENLSAARRTYNMRVTNYNTFISTIPNNLFAKLFRFKKHQLFEISDKDKEGKIFFNEK